MILIDIDSVEHLKEVAEADLGWMKRFGGYEDAFLAAQMQCPHIIRIGLFVDLYYKNHRETYYYVPDQRSWDFACAAWELVKTVPRVYVVDRSVWIQKVH